MLKEISIAASNNSQNISTIYFGGGTPSLMSASELESFIQAISAAFKVDAEAEITLEANPDDINTSSVDGWREAGINRLSIGIQSFLDTDLVWMNRAHNAGQALRSIHMARAAGFDNFSIDLIYGTPTLSDDQWKRNVETVIELEVPHISSYALTVEEGTALHHMIANKKISPVMQEKQAEHFSMLMDWMAKAGYEHYEISNFAKPGKRSRHNSSYWKGDHYIGIGPSAHSFKGRSRSWNVANNILYTKQLEAGILPAETEDLSTSQQLNEYIMISLRTIEGIDLDFVRKNFGEKIAAKLAHNAEKFSTENKCILGEQHISLSNAGKLFADGIAADLFFDEGEMQSESLIHLYGTGDT